MSRVFFAVRSRKNRVPTRLRGVSWVIELSGELIGIDFCLLRCWGRIALLRRPDDAPHKLVVSAFFRRNAKRLLDPRTAVEVEAAQKDTRNAAFAASVTWHSITIEKRRVDAGSTGAGVDALTKYARAVARGGLCVGLDPDLQRLPAAVGGDVLLFLREIIRATADQTFAYKLNAAFYEAQGAAGWRIMEQLRSELPKDTLLILDGKRGDIHSSNSAYARAAFDVLGADAITVHPYLGIEPLSPFFQRDDRLTFVLCATSEGRTLQTLSQAHGEPLYLWVARQVAALARPNCGLVVGATAEAELSAVRAVAPGLPLLVPGVGAQGGQWPTGPALVNVSRSILYASAGPDFAASARQAAQRLLEANACNGARHGN